MTPEFKAIATLSAVLAAVFLVYLMARSMTKWSDEAVERMCIMLAGIWIISGLLFLYTLLVETYS